MGLFHKKDIARLQLETAVNIFLRGLDRSSVITLAGAASGILDTLVRRAGKEPFIDYGRRFHHAVAGYTLKRKAYSHHLDKTLGIIAHKHLAKDDSETVEIDLEKKALQSLLRAMTDYIALNGQDEAFVKVFLQWTWMNNDGPRLMEWFGQVPEKMKPR